MKLPVRKRGSSVQPPMTPMIDVVFLLLVFFLWSSNFDLPEFDLHGGLATSQMQPGGKEPLEDSLVLTDEVVIRIAADGTGYRFFLNNQPIVDLDAVGQRLRTLAATGVRSPVIVHPDPDIPLEVAVTVYDLANRSGFAEVLFASDP